ncbi:efflux RND transporter periplasmic adaptor subunit [Candidatus Gromoviella agglomerans]|uniref:efflux RND transporter periplasmic adaptor subunit n=1 Tax=Candidatus Gromoviella agglomerans TaxID=2806609 RepID=UPI001E45C8D1|nr:efflux RND transporter periplasmic adaptor subunit [Candidatus Gromoviella agglomerans]UFX98304.1 Acr transporter superfamily protein [Candidatus Gromoviella agglomerans]
MNKIRVFYYICAVGLLSGCSNQKDKEISYRKQNVEVSRVYSDKVVESYRTSASVNAVRTFEVHCDIKGYIKKIHFTPNSYVKEGQLLYEIDSQDIEAKYESALATLKKSQATYQRASNLYNTDSISINDLESAKEKFEVAAANLKEAEALKKRSNIVSPISGKIGVSYKLVGATTGYDDMRTSATTKLAVVVDDSSFYIEFHVPQRIVEYIENGNIQVLLDNSGSSFVNASFVGRDVVADNSKMFLVRAKIDNLAKNYGLLPGKSVTVVVDIQKASSGLFVPKISIKNEEGKSYVFCVKSGFVQKIEVIAGVEKKDSNDVHVSPVEDGSLVNGDEVVISGVHSIYDNMPVDVVSNS